MKIAYFDTVGGISGDMTLGAFVSAGMPADLLVAELKKLPIGGYEIETRHVERHGIVATKVDVNLSGDEHVRRHLNDVVGLIDRSGLKSEIRQRAQSIFREIAEAESRVHRIPVEKVHFHEVGAVDSLVDIVGAAVCLDFFGVEEAYSSPVRVGRQGFVEAQHGRLPVPTPATMEILKDYPIVLTDATHEMTTPTGAAIIKALSKGLLSTERMVVRSVGYGAGEREVDAFPNVLRIMVGDLDQPFGHDEVVSVETNIDDMNPELYPYVLDQLLAAGAHDAYLIPVVMKKGRPGILLSTLVERSKMESILGILFRETSTLGVRIQPVERRKLVRESRTVRTSFGEVRVKAVVYDGKERLVPEFEECKRIAMARGLPLIQVYSTLEKELHT